MRNNLGCAYRNRDVDAVRVALQAAAIGREARRRRRLDRLACTLAVCHACLYNKVIPIPADRRKTNLR